jgi:hypothetical protein
VALLVRDGMMSLAIVLTLLFLFSSFFFSFFFSPFFLQFFADLSRKRVRSVVRRSAVHRLRRLHLHHTSVAGLRRRSAEQRRGGGAGAQSALGGRQRVFCGKFVCVHLCERAGRAVLPPLPPSLPLFSLTESSYYIDFGSELRA